MHKNKSVGLLHYNVSLMYTGFDKKQKQKSL